VVRASFVRCLTSCARLEQLEARMKEWLTDQYFCVVARHGREPVGYVLGCPESDYLYLRQLFVAPTHRRSEVGRRLFEEFLRLSPQAALRVRINVLVTNKSAVAFFWHRVGFEAYAIVMERPFA